jgi:hypothetical protein
MADSRECQALVRYAFNSGVPHIRSSYFCTGHAPGGYHCRPGTGAIGTAVDFQDPWPRDKPGLLAIFTAFLRVETQLAELIYSGASFNIKDGKRVGRYAIDAHWNHVHAATKCGTFVSWSTTPAPVPPAPIPKPTLTYGTPVEVDMQLIPLRVDISIDPQGKGWTRIPHAIETVVGPTPHSGTRPAADGGYDGTPDVIGITPEDGGTIIVVQGGNPGGSAPVWLHIIA